MAQRDIRLQSRPATAMEGLATAMEGLALECLSCLGHCCMQLTAYSQSCSYADKSDKILICVGVVSAVANGEL